MKTNRPFFTIGIPTHNRASYLKLAIESVLKQSFKNYEILIVDNKSTDNTESVVNIYCQNNKNITYIKNAVNVEGMGSLKKLFNRARGTYLFLLCDDDIILKSNTLSGLYKIIQNKKPGFVKLEALFYFKKISNIIKCFKFERTNVIIKPDNPHFVEKTFNKFIEFWSGNIYRLEPKLFPLINTNDWLYTSLDYIFAQVQKNGAVFTGDYCILGRYIETINMATLIDPNFSLDTHLKTVKKYVPISEYSKIDDNLRKAALSTIINCRLYATWQLVFLYIKKVYKNDKKPSQKILYYLFAFLVLLTPKVIFVLFKKLIYHPVLKKEAMNYILKKRLSSLLAHL